MSTTQKLEEAKAILEEIKKTLNISSNKCPSCTTVHYTNWKEHKANEALKAAITRITKASSLLAQEQS